MSSPKSAWALSRTSKNDLQSSPQIANRKGSTAIPRPGLYVVATPIGNARDITLRALDILQSADIIACEDTRITRRLLKMYGIERRTIAYHDHNAGRIRPRLIQRLKKGEIIALVCDAGTPLISDPGYRLVKQARESEIYVTALPGASAPLVALASAGLPTNKFLFMGFLPAKSGARGRALAEVAGISATLVFFESATRLVSSLTQMATKLGLREAVVLRELTKRFEEARYGDLENLAEYYKTEGPPKGEIVVLVGPPGGHVVGLDDAAIDCLMVNALQGNSVKDAAASLAELTGLSRRDLYNRALVLRSLKDSK